MTHVCIDRSGPVGTIRLDRPERHNALDVAMAQDLRHAALSLVRDAEIRVVVLRGLPGVFCSGVDLKYVREGGFAADLGYLQPVSFNRPAGSGAIFKQILEYLNATIVEIRRAPKPVVAAVEGVAAAGGMGLALCCDLVLASDRARFEWAYSRTGLSGAESATFFLPRLLGFRRAADLALLDEPLDARAAHHLGLVSSVGAQDDFDAHLEERVARLLTRSSPALARAKALLNRASGMDELEEHLTAELDALVASADGADFASGLERFFDRPAEAR